MRKYVFSIRPPVPGISHGILPVITKAMQGLPGKNMARHHICDNVTKYFNVRRDEK